MARPNSTYRGARRNLVVREILPKGMWRTLGFVLMNTNKRVVGGQRMKQMLAPGSVGLRPAR